MKLIQSSLSGWPEHLLRSFDTLFIDCPVDPHLYRIVGVFLSRG